MGAAVLVGRDREIAVLARLLERTPPSGAVLLMLGDPGIGKSSLLHEAESSGRARGFRILRLAGVECEATLPFAGLHQMVGPVLDQVSLLPRHEREALLAAFGLVEGLPPEPFLINLAVVDLLAAVAADRPVLVLADDVQWLDPQSHEVLTFVGRRVAGPVVIVAVMRRGHTGPFLHAGFPELTVGGVDDDAAAQILSAHAPGLTPTEQRRIRREALGNPLALRELPIALAALPSGGLRPLTLSDRLEHAFAGRGAELPSATRDGLLVAAVDPADDLAEIIAGTSALRGEPVTPEVFDPAQAVGLVTVEEGRVAFLHPLMRSGILQAESLARHQSAHRALADILDEVYRRTWHRAQSIVGPDDRIADALEANAAQALSRGAVFAAINDLERSAELTSWSALRGHRLLMAAGHAFGMGREDIVHELLQSAARTDLTDLDRARMEWLREMFDRTPGGAARVNELCDLALRSAPADPDLALDILLAAALRSWWGDTGPAARARVVACVDRLPEMAGDPRYVLALAAGEPVLRARQVVEALAGMSPGGDADALRLLGIAAHGVGHMALSAELLARSEGTLRRQGRLGLLSHVLTTQSFTYVLLGDLVRAADTAEEGRRLAAETGQPAWGVTQLVCDVMLKAFVGDAQEALRGATEAELGEARGRNVMLSALQLTRGLVSLAAGRNRDAYRTLRAIFDPAEPSFHQRHGFLSLMFLADAAVCAGHREDARELVAELEVIARETPSPLLHVHLLYARAVLAADEDAEDFYLAALRQDLSHWPYARAKVELAYGSWLRRQKRVHEARSLLTSAQATFDRIGALPCGDEARLELRATGAPIDWPESSAERLRQITELSALRLADDEIAERLSLRRAVVAMYRDRTRPDTRR
ncbi:AAA ATPase domain-containing protein [Streptomyces sp. OV198]|uniref:AAA family ATPase n=1 Tax=Streptomyces sp. OV198 TaxID=1882787 RepID=UPI000BC99CB5|nr:ATP-binding protein [Streptomyces sp. OV198]SOE79588.1 AAA ATPase domain-containing protein [Streptomyces sp. OV198]